MFLIQAYSTAILMCVVTMLCWGSWANTQKLVDKKWRYELFYWDYVFGLLATALAFAMTLGSHGEVGRAYLADLSQATMQSVLWACAGGVVFNIANILLVSAIDIAGMAVAFPVGIGLALVLGVLLNYVNDPASSGNPLFLFVGVGLVAVAIVISALSYKKRDAANADANAEKKPIGKGIALSIVCGVLMSLFYLFVAKSLAKVEVGGALVDLTLANLSLPGAALEIGKLTPYTANLVFAFGILLSNCVIMPILMKHPFVGEPVEKGAYWKGSFGNHFWGWVGGCIWAIGMTVNVLASGVASPAVAYGLGQGATLMSAIWGVFIWREFRGSPKGVGKMLAAMFVCFVVGLALIIVTKLDSGDAAAAEENAAVVEEETVAIPEFEEVGEVVIEGVETVEESEAAVEAEAAEEAAVEAEAVEEAEEVAVEAEAAEEAAEVVGEELKMADPIVDVIEEETEIELAPAE